MTDGLVSHKWNYSPVLFLLSQRALHTHCISSVNNTLPHTHWTKVESLSFLCEHSRRKLSDPVGHLFRDCRSPGGYFKPAVPTFKETTIVQNPALYLGTIIFKYILPTPLSTALTNSFCMDYSWFLIDGPTSSFHCLMSSFV